MRGPLVYCAEQADNGANIASLRFIPGAAFSQKESFAGEGTLALTLPGQRAVFSEEEKLYRQHLPTWHSAQITLIPYYLWANRSVGEMQIYLKCADEPPS